MGVVRRVVPVLLVILAAVGCRMKDEATTVSLDLREGWAIQ